MLAALDLARAVLAGELAAAPRERQRRIIAAHGELTVLAAQAPTYNFDPGLLVMEIGGLLASAAMPREAASTSLDQRAARRHGRTLLPHHRDQLSQRQAAYRPCL